MSRAAASRTAASRAAGVGRASGEDPSDAETPSPVRATPTGYFARTELPFASLAFLLPLVVLYEVGTRLFATDPARQVEQRIIAFDLLQRFFHWFGASGRYLPAMAVVGILLACHIARRDLWEVSPWHVLGMLVECIILTLPLPLMGALTSHYLPLWAVPSTLNGLLVMSIGAGIYEELVFRLIAFTLLSILFVDLLRIRRGWSAIWTVGISAILFSLYHYLGNEHYTPQSFAFRSVAGVYFGAIFLCRGFGITAGTHAAYDVIATMLLFRNSI